MNSTDHRHVDNQLAKLKAALDDVETPESVEHHFQNVLKKNASASTPLNKIDLMRSNKWIPISIAASICIVSILASVLLSTIPNSPVNNVTEVDHTGADNKYIIGRVYSPISYHSLSRGPEIRYLKSQMIHSRNETTLVSYLNLPSEE